MRTILVREIEDNQFMIQTDKSNEAGIAAQFETARMTEDE